MQYRIKIFPLFLILIFFSLSFTSLIQKSPTKDEAAHHIATGYVYLKKGDLRFNTCSPPLSQYIMALPLLFLNLNLSGNPHYWRKEDRAEFSYNFIYKDNRKKAAKIILLSRSAILVLVCLGAAVLYYFIRVIYSQNSALIFLFLFCFSPNIIAHSRLATTDALFMIFSVLSMLSFWLFIEKRHNYRIMLTAALFFALALLSKYTAVFLIPFYLLWFFIQKRSNKQLRNRLILLFFLAAFLFVWSGYKFEFQSLLNQTMRPQEKITAVTGYINKLPYFPPRFKNKLAHSILYTSFPLSSYVLGLLGVIRHANIGHSVYFLGKYINHGSYFFYLVAFLVKTPIAAIILFLFSIVAVFINRKRVNFYLLSAIIYFFLIASLARLQLGLRYILNIYPLIFVLCAVFLDNLFNQRKKSKFIGIVLLGWFAIESLLIYPNYLAYFNELAGGPRNGYKLLRDSNCDWGQDLILISRYLRKKGIKKVKLAYDGSADPAYYGINYGNILLAEYAAPQDNAYVISTNLIDNFKWTRHKKPQKVIGNTTFVYDLRHPH